MASLSFCFCKKDGGPLGGGLLRAGAGRTGGNGMNKMCLMKKWYEYYANGA